MTVTSLVTNTLIYKEIKNESKLTFTDKDGNESEIALDILKDTGEARVIIYKVGSDEPDEIISLN